MKTLKVCAAALLMIFLVLGTVSAQEPVESEGGSEMEPLILMPELRMPEVGEAAPVFEITTVDGEPYNLENETEDKVVSIVFWSLFCAPCRRSMPILENLYKEIGNEKFELLAINMDGERMREGVKNYVAEEGLSFVFLMDEFDGDALKVADPYGVQGTPTIFMIGRSGNIIFSKAGDAESSEIKSLIMAEMDGGKDPGSPQILQETQDSGAQQEAEASNSVETKPEEEVSESVEARQDPENPESAENLSARQSPEHSEEIE